MDDEPTRVDASVLRAEASEKEEEEETLNMALDDIDLDPLTFQSDDAQPPQDPNERTATMMRARVPVRPLPFHDVPDHEGAPPSDPDERTAVGAVLSRAPALPFDDGSEEPLFGPEERTDVVRRDLAERPALPFGEAAGAARGLSPKKPPTALESLSDLRRAFGTSAVVDEAASPAVRRASSEGSSPVVTISVIVIVAAAAALAWMLWV